MKRCILALSTASALVLAGVVSAGQQLTSDQMDGITAGGAATGTATAAAVGVVTAISHAVNTQVLSTALNPGELGGIFTIASHADSASTAGAQTPLLGTALATASSVGDTVGTGQSDTNNDTGAGAVSVYDPAVPVWPQAAATAAGQGAATSVVIGLNASAMGQSVAGAALGN
jgi:hypothetical protein